MAHSRNRRVFTGRFGRRPVKSASSQSLSLASASTRNRSMASSFWVVLLVLSRAFTSRANVFIGVVAYRLLALVLPHRRIRCAKIGRDTSELQPREKLVCRLL